MQMIEHTIALRGEACDGATIDSEAAGALLYSFPSLVRDSVRMGILRSSHRAGKPMKELASAWDIRFAGQSRGPNFSVLFHVLAPRLEDAAPRLFEQRTLFEEIAAPDDTGIDLAGRMVADVAGNVKESERYDTDLLKRLVAFDKVLRHGIDIINLGGHKLNNIQQTAIDRQVIKTAVHLFEETPPPRRVRVMGTLDMIRISNRVFELLLLNGQRVRAVWATDSVVQLKEYLSMPVLIEGNAIYRPSGSLLRIDAGAIAPAGDDDTFFSEIPKATISPRNMRTERRPQTDTTGINAIWGKWPGEESEQDLLQTLKELR